MEENLFKKILSYFRDIEKLKEIPQNPLYHAEGNVYYHTQLVCTSLSKFKEWNNLSKERRMILSLAAFFHDIGKQVCTKIEDGIISSPKHAIIGAKMFRERCYFSASVQYHIPYTIREQIAWLIRYHGLPLLFLEKENTDLWIRRAASQTDLELLYLLAKADLYGRECKNKDILLEQIEYFKEYAIELNCFYQKPIFKNEYTQFQYLRGKSQWYSEFTYNPCNFNVYLMVGLPLSGKDTYIKTYMPNIPEISLDQIRKKLHISPSQSSKKIASIATEQAKIYLRNKQAFVWNATNIVRETREKLCVLFEAYGAKITIIYLEVPYKELLLRNKYRERIVPVPIINKLIRKLDMIEPWEAQTIKYIISE